MSDNSENKTKKTLSLTKKLPDGAVAGTSESTSHGHSSKVNVEVKKSRVLHREAKPKIEEARPIEKAAQQEKPKPSSEPAGPKKPDGLTDKEWLFRLEAVKARSVRIKEQEIEQIASDELAAIENKASEGEAKLEQQNQKEENIVPEEESIESIIIDSLPAKAVDHEHKTAPKHEFKKNINEDQEEAELIKSKTSPKGAYVALKTEKTVDRRGSRLTVEQAIIATETDEDITERRKRSEAAIRRAREKERQKQLSSLPKERTKIVREVIIPETITVGELANRMTEKSTDVIKTLMKMGMMVTINQTIDADTAELVAEEFGHKVNRVADSDIEFGIEGPEDSEATMMPRAPVVTIMGHVDHGKTSLLDALRETDVVKGEAGGITQHIGAYQVEISTGQKITFIDTPGHAAFTEMRSRGAKITDIVILVVAADDGIKEQTVEAIHHVKAAGVPMIVAINKIDKPGANVDKVIQELLQHEIVVESLGGDTLTVEVSAKQRLNLDKLEEAILLQAEVLDLKANPNRSAVGTVVEAKIEQGKGSVATVLIEKGTIKIGDVFVAGKETGRVKALINSRGQRITEGFPSEPVEIIGCSGTPSAGDKLIVVQNDAVAKEIADYRDRKEKSLKVAKHKPTSLEDIFAASKDSDKKELSVIVRADVQGSVEAIIGSLEKLEHEEVKVTILHSGVGGITESDVILANASKGIIIGFNVRANTQARELAKRDDVPIKYYSIIYNVIDDIKAAVSGMLSPIEHERYLGKAQIRQVFNVTKTGKIAGCMVTEGVVKRGANVRLIRDDVVIHEGFLKTLRRFKDEVKEAKEGYECGMAFENYSDIKENDIIECFEIERVSRSI